MLISDWSSDVCSSDLALSPTSTICASPDAPIWVRFAIIPPPGSRSRRSGAGGSPQQRRPCASGFRPRGERKSVVEGKRGLVSVKHGGRRIIKKKTEYMKGERYPY